MEALDGPSAGEFQEEKPFQPLWYGDLQSAKLEPQRWIWHGYLGAGQITLLTSQWKLGKSTLLSVLLGRMKAGGELAGLAVQPGKAAIVSEEAPARWYERGQNLQFGNHLCWFCRPFQGRPSLEQWSALIEQIGGLHRLHHLDLVVFDPLANLAPWRSENDAAEVLMTLTPLQRLTELGLGVFLLHHPRKGALVAGQAARGSGALGGFVDVIVEMQRVSRRRPKDRRRRLLAYSRHEATLPSWVIELTEDGADYRGLGESSTPTFEAGWPLLKARLERARRPLSRLELLDDWPDESMRPSKLTMWRWLNRAAEEGMLNRTGEGTRKDPHCYYLPGMELRWQDAFNAAFLAPTIYANAGSP